MPLDAAHHTNKHTYSRVHTCMCIYDVVRLCCTSITIYLLCVLLQLDKVDEMTCWKTDECPVEDNSRFTKAWAVHSAERNPTMETHFDSEVMSAGCFFFYHYYCQS